MAEEGTQVQVPTDVHDVGQMWERLPEGLKARAMRYLYEEQQKLVVELQRQSMEKGVEIAVSVVRARAAEELHQDELKSQIIEKEIIPKREELQELERRIAEERTLLDMYSTIGKGII